MTRRSNRSSQVLRAVLRLRELILTGALVPGERVAELKVVGATGVSRTPLRIALERLAHEGLVERRARGGFVVRAFTLAEIEQAVDVRGVLEGAAARAAAERGGENVAARLRGLTGELDAVVGDLPALPAFEAYVDLNARFHRALVEASANSMLVRLVEQVSALPFASPSAFLRVQALTPEFQQILTIAQEHHRTIVEAIAHHEGARAEAIAREHARLALRNLHHARADGARWHAMPGASLLRLG